MEKEFAGSITFKGTVSIKGFEDFVCLKNLTKNGDSNVFFYGNTELNTKQEILEYLKKEISSEIIAYDLSISTEDKVEILDFDEVDGEYSIMTVSGIGNDFNEILESFEENEEVICVREAEVDSIFGEKTIKIDIIS